MDDQHGSNPGVRRAQPNCCTDLADIRQSQHQPTCCWKGSHVLQGLKNIPQLGPCECLEPAEQEVEMLARPG